MALLFCCPQIQLQKRVDVISSTWAWFFCESFLDCKRIGIAQTPMTAFINPFQHWEDYAFQCLEAQHIWLQSCPKIILAWKIVLCLEQRTRWLPLLLLAEFKETDGWIFFFNISVMMQQHTCLEWLAMVNIQRKGSMDASQVSATQVHWRILPARTSFAFLGLLPLPGHRKKIPGQRDRRTK